MGNVAVIGGGIIGLSTAWQLARNGFTVSVFDKGEVGADTSSVAAGMLAPHAEVKFEEEALMHLGLFSLRQYPSFLAQLADDLGEAPELDQCGTLLAAVSRDDTNQLKRFFQYRDALGVEAEWLTGSEVREKEPQLSPRVTSALWLPEDAHIDNKELLKDLKAVLNQWGQPVFEHTEIHTISQNKNKTWTVKGGDQVETYDNVIMATGPSILDMLSDKNEVQNFGFRPVKGEIVALGQQVGNRLQTMVRTPRGYLVPKGENGTLLIGATSYEQGFDVTPTAGGVKDLLEFGYEVVPATYDLPYQGTNVGLRPATKDNNPVIGPSVQKGLYWAAGHYRHGFLLAPVTAYGLKQHLMNEDKPAILKRFGPERFNE